jgi:outer membrane lipoprotein SlyB
MEDKTMYQKTLTRIAAIFFAFVLAACATSGGQTGEVEIRSGVIEQITPVQLTSNQGLGVGAVVGGVVGLGVGSLIGKGSGRDVAMVLGTIGGAYAGHKVQQRYKDPVQGQQVVVRTTTGVLVTVTQPANPNLAVGQNVAIEGNGEDARVVPR